MRIASFVIGGLLLIGGAVAVAVADQQRQDALEHARAAVETAQSRLDEAESRNAALAESLVQLRSLMYDQEDDFDDTEGFLR